MNLPLGRLVGYGFVPWEGFSYMAFSLSPLLIEVILQQPNIAASLGAFALWCNGGDRVITWGQGIYGGDVSDWA